MRLLAGLALALAFMFVAYALLASDAPATAQVGGAVGAATPTPSDPNDGGDGAGGQADPSSAPARSAGVGGASGQAAQAALATPSGLAGTGRGSTITLTWNAVEGASGYEVQQWDGLDWRLRWRDLPLGSRSIVFSAAGTRARTRADRRIILLGNNLPNSQTI